MKMFYFYPTELIMDRDDPDYEDGANGTYITVLTSRVKLCVILSHCDKRDNN